MTFALALLFLTPVLAHAETNPSTAERSVQHYAALYRVPPELIVAFIDVESRWDSGRTVVVDAQGHVSPEEVRAALRSVYREDPESNLQKALLRVLADGLKPIDDKGRWKPSPLLLLIAVLVCALIGVFFYFTLGAHK